MAALHVTSLASFGENGSRLLSLAEKSAPIACPIFLLQSARPSVKKHFALPKWWNW
jgi:hypothetical protein